MSYSKVTKKGQITILLKYRKKYNLMEGTTVTFRETEEGLLLKPVPDITESAGALSSYADLKEVLLELTKSRKEDFR
ncbi:MAG: AbrB/MazE/SpoVT family DNA-binding domain-containing protein [Candidatus Bathyarchaeia archaeon]